MILYENRLHKNWVKIMQQADDIIQMFKNDVHNKFEWSLC